MSQPSMSDVARAALYREGGITYLFDNADYTSPEACRKAMVKFRNAFYAFKAKERRRIQREQQRTDIPTMYDGLGCSVDQASSGWKLTICVSIYDGSKMVDADGKPIDWAAERADHSYEIEQEVEAPPPMRIFNQ